MTPEQLSQTILDVLTTLVDAGEVRLPEQPVDVRVERPKNKEHGDYATNVALQVAKQADMAPRELAALLVARLKGAPGIASVEIAGPGFINVRVKASAQGTLARQVVEAGTEYGTSEALSGQTVNLEFISANPTGPLHLGHTRWAAVGDAMGRVLQAAGAEVTREFYINDRGNQLEKFGESIMAAAQGHATPEDGYHGDYIAELAKAIVSDDPGVMALPDDEQLVAFREEGLTRQLLEQRRQLDEFRTHIDVWASERELHESGKVEHGIDKLRSQGHVYEQDGALWMRTTDFGDDKDRVLVRANGVPAYFASDTAYYVDKRERGFDRCIFLLGADHHGYVGRLKAMAACAGDDPEVNIEVMIGQLVKILRHGEEVRLSKRAGSIVTLQEIVDLIGVDALRYTLSRYPVDSPLALDVEVVTRRTADNPVFYVQYAHARLASILRNAADLGVSPAGVDFDPGLLAHEREGDLLRALGEYPRVVAQAAELREPHRVARYLEASAAAFHKFYDECRVLPRGDEDASHQHAARLLLVQATQVVLANGLGLLGVEAPERM